MREPCSELSPKISRLLDRELSPDEARSVESHLATCADCAAERDRLARVDGLLRVARPPSEVEWARILSRARRAPSLGWRALAAAVLLAVAIPGAVAIAIRRDASSCRCDPISPVVVTSEL